MSHTHQILATLTRYDISNTLSALKFEFRRICALIILLQPEPKPCCNKSSSSCCNQAKQKSCINLAALKYVIRSLMLWKFQELDIFIISLYSPREYRTSDLSRSSMKLHPNASAILSSMTRLQCRVPFSIELIIWTEQWHSSASCFCVHPFCLLWNLIFEPTRI